MLILPTRKPKQNLMAQLIEVTRSPLFMPFRPRYPSFALEVIRFLGKAEHIIKCLHA